MPKRKHQKDPDPDYSNSVTIRIDNALDNSDYEPVSKRTRLGGNGFPGALREPDEFELELPCEKGTVVRVDQNILGLPVPAPFRFLDLPAEGRIVLYKIWREDVFCNDDRTPHVFLRNQGHCNLRLVSRQINKEWTPYFLQSTSINIYYGHKGPRCHAELQDRRNPRDRQIIFGSILPQQPYDRKHVEIHYHDCRVSGPSPVDHVLGVMNSVAFSNLGALEYEVGLSVMNKWPSAGYFSAECFCTDFFRYGRRHLQERRQGKLLMQITCFEFWAGNRSNCNFNKVLLFDKTHPEDYSAIVQKAWCDCEKVARTIVDRFITWHLSIWGESYTEYNDCFGKIFIRFTKIPQNSTPDSVAGYLVEYPAEGATVVDVFGSPGGIPDQGLPQWCKEFFPPAYRLAVSRGSRW